MGTNYAVQISGPGFSVTSDDSWEQWEGNELVPALCSAIEMAQNHIAGSVNEFLASIVREIACNSGRSVADDDSIAQAEKLFIDAAFAVGRARLRQQEELTISLRDSEDAQPEKPPGPSGVP